jgi:hypothetical protein
MVAGTGVESAPEVTACDHITRDFRDICIGDVLAILRRLGSGAWGGRKGFAVPALGPAAFAAIFHHCLPLAGLRRCATPLFSSIGTTFQLSSTLALDNVISHIFAPGLLLETRGTAEFFDIRVAFTITQQVGASALGYFATGRREKTTFVIRAARRR